MDCRCPARSQWGPQWHDGGSARIFEFFGDDGVITGVRHDYKTLFNQNFRGFHQLFGVGIEGLFIADDFELDKVRQAGFPRQFSRQHCRIGIVTTGGIRENRKSIPIDIIEQGFAGTGEFHATHRYRDHVRSGCFMTLLHQFHGRVFSRAHDQSRLEFLAPKDQWIGFHSFPSI